MSSHSCPACGQDASGRFCSQCGANLEGPRRCPACDHELPPGGRFCNMCGTPAAISAAAATNNPSEPVPRSTSNLPWIITGGVLVALVGALLLPRFRDSDPAAAEGPPITGTATGAAAVDLSSMTPREAADRLFNRVMQNVSAGDTAAARQFIPMALMAYERVPDLDLDGRYHVAALHMVNADPQAARAEAERILGEAPDHLFGLVIAAQAERALGNEAAARELYARFLESYEAEVALARTEYQDHSRILPAMREEAQQAVGGG